MKPLLVRVHDKDRQLLELEARRLGQPLSQVVRTALGQYIAKKKIRSLKSLAQSLAHIAQKYQHVKSPTDLAIRYKHYLYGKSSQK
ncbi:hypothetical protein HY388_01515 [Candidatus Daviesbacteria bacterium]|nr:hypothetical protein [Candidatus Daviesbacteria bacterium]